MSLKNWCSTHAKWSKSSLKNSIRFCGVFPSLKQNFIAYRSSKLSSRPDYIWKIQQLWQSDFSRVYSNSWLICSFKPEIIKIGQSPHKMYSNNIPNFQESTTILNACTKNSGNLLNTPRRYPANIGCSHFRHTIPKKQCMWDIRRKKWTRENNTKVNHCYFKINPTQKAYRKRTMEIWTESSKFNKKKQWLTDKTRLIFKRLAIWPWDVLRKCTGDDKFSKSLEKINHLMYMDDIKVIENNEKEMENLNKQWVYKARILGWNLKLKNLPCSW